MSYEFLAPGFRNQTPGELLVHFQKRSNVKSFAVRDAEAGPEHVTDVLEDRFTFNGEMHHLPAESDWKTNPSEDDEWLILLHKFYFAVGLGEDYHRTGQRKYADKWVELTWRWIHTVPAEFLPTDVAARRMQNWIFANHYFVEHHAPPDIPADFYMDFLASIHAQVTYIRANLARARNHRTMELYAIFMAAVVFPEMGDAAAWLDFSREELATNLEEDFLADGVHCEMSTDYHLLVVKNFLGVVELARLNDIPLPAKMATLLQRALEFASYVHKPDGNIPSLSDGDSRSFLAVLDQGYRLFGNEHLRYVATQGSAGSIPPHKSVLFPDSGYTIFRSGWGETEPFEDERYLIFDCGPLGRGNHGHLDLLSFEMAAYGRSLVVDPGRYTYHQPPEGSPDVNWRALFRGTGYHNTVLVDGRDQTRHEFHKSRVKIRGPEPDHELVRFVSEPGFDFVHGIARSHEYEAVHERKIFFARPDYWLVLDLLSSPKEHVYELLFHLAAKATGKTAIRFEHDTLTIDAPGLVLAQPANPEAKASLEPGFVSTAYGVKRSAPIAKIARVAATTSFTTVLFPYQGVRPTISVERLPVKRNSEVCDDHEAVAIQVTIERPDGIRVDTFFAANQPDQYEISDIACRGSHFLARRQGDTLDINSADDTVAEARQASVR